MKCFSARVAIPTLTTAENPLVVPLVLSNAVIKRVLAFQATVTAGQEKLGFRITNQGTNIFPFFGLGVNAREAGYAPLVNGPPLDVEIHETLDGPPYNVELRFFNLTAVTGYADVLIFTDGTEKTRQINHIQESDKETEKVSG